MPFNLFKNVLWKQPVTKTVEKVFLPVSKCFSPTNICINTNGKKQCLTFDRLAAWRIQNPVIPKPANNQNNLQHRSRVLGWFNCVSLKSRNLSNKFKEILKVEGLTPLWFTFYKAEAWNLAGGGDFLVSEIGVLPFLWKSVSTWWKTKPLKSFCTCSEETW